MPTNNEGVRILQEAGVLFAPGKAANAGGVAVSGLEMSQNSIRVSWTADELEARLRTIMSGIHAQCVKHGQAPGGIDYVRGANVAGFIKVADAMIAYGVM
jgi:glutamate dehydrogenase (NADP+)